MKYQTQEEFINEIKELKKLMKEYPFEFGISRSAEKKLFNRVNKILRIAKCTVFRVDFSKLGSLSQSNGKVGK